MLAFVLLFTLLLALTLLLWRQIRLTRRARKDVNAWKQLYEQVRSDRAALLKAVRAQKGKEDAMASRTGTQPKSPGGPGAGPKVKQPEMNRPPARVVKPSGRTSEVAEPLTLVLPIQLLSKNARDKLHFHARGKLRKQYREIIELKYPRRTPTPQVRQQATVTRVKGPRERDFDEQNIGAGSAIELIDALTAAGYWADDSTKWLETVFAQSSSGKVKGPAVLVEIKTLS